MTSSIYKIIQNKQLGYQNSKKEISDLINQYTNDQIPDYQMSAWLMAVYFQGMCRNEVEDYTEVLIKSGKQLNMSHLPGFVIDKHSTGGVGDKVSFILGPILAACGCFVPMLAGRGLSYTGGTIDKLESIPDYKTNLEINDFKKIVEDVGISIMGQTEEICPADKKIYSLRDVTSTISSYPLICGSILSKKIAEGIDGLVLDVKIGNGAFMKTLNEGKKIAKIIQEVGELHGIQLYTCITDMNQPLGYSAGLWCEIEESIQCLKGVGSDDLLKVVLHLGENALKLAKIKKPKSLILSMLKNGKALDIFYRMLEAHGVKIKKLKDQKINKPKFKTYIFAKSKGYINKIDTEKIGLGLIHLGAGRFEKNDKLDNSAGMKFLKKRGDFVLKKDKLVKIFCSNKDKIENAKNILNQTYHIGPNKIKESQLIYK